MRHKCFQTNARQRGAAKAPSPAGTFAPKEIPTKDRSLEKSPQYEPKMQPT